MTQDHCSYCDAFPVEGVSAETIDHFRPKARYPLQVCFWSNLFYACTCCQGHKGEQFSPQLLHPDAPGYTFERYFIYDYATGDILINPQATLPEQDRARWTIQVLGLNLSGRPKTRKRMVTRFLHLPAPLQRERDELPYRFALL